jgi:hydrogenase expression/formation protein HypE
MRIGKLSDADLRRLVLDRLPKDGARTVTGPGTGLDCAIVRTGEGEGLAVLTCDPITGADAGLGRLAVNVACNDIAAAGLSPRCLLLSIIAPPTADPERIAGIVDEASAAAAALGVDIVGGHTEVSDAVTRFVLHTTAVGFSQGRPVLSAACAQHGDALLMTRTAGIEGTAILAADRAAALATSLSAEELRAAAAFAERLSVVADGLAAATAGAHAMHDATEGGVLGAAWEMASAAGLGLAVDADAIPVDPLTARLCAALSIDPLRLIASGSMLIATDRPDAVAAALAAAGIPSARIGTFARDAKLVLRRNGSESPLEAPGPDELFAALC